MLHGWTPSCSFILRARDSSQIGGILSGQILYRNEVFQSQFSRVKCRELIQNEQTNQKCPDVDKCLYLKSASISEALIVPTGTRSKKSQELLHRVVMYLSRYGAALRTWPLSSCYFCLRTLELSPWGTCHFCPSFNNGPPSSKWHALRSHIHPFYPAISLFPFLILFFSLPYLPAFGSGL